MDIKLSDTRHRHPEEFTKPTTTRSVDPETGESHTVTTTPTRGYAIIKWDLETGRVLYTKPISRDEAIRRGVPAEE